MPVVVQSPHGPILTVELAEGGALVATSPTPYQHSVIIGLSLPTLRFEQGATSAVVVASKDEACSFARELLRLFEQT